MTGESMYCTACGSSVIGAAQFCHRCGVAVAGAEITQPTAAIAAPTFTAVSTVKQNGVRGWLLLLCLGLCVFGPLIALAGGNLMLTARAALVQIPGGAHLVTAFLVLGAAETFVSFYAGALLWTRAPGAVGFTKTVIIAGPLTVLVMAGLTQTLGHDETRNAIMKELAQGLIKQIAVSAIWLAYLFRSKRVRVTFGESTLVHWYESQPRGAIVAAIIGVLIVLLLLASPDLSAAFLFGDSPGRS